MNSAIIAGGGLAGAAVAAALGRAGRAVTLFERDGVPAHKICGEFLSTEAQAYLSKLGLDPAALPGHPISHLRLVRGSHVITAELPFRGIGISRKYLDEALLTYAAACGAQIMRGHSVRALDLHDLTLQVHPLGTVHPRTLFLATGKHDLRGSIRGAGRRAKSAGFKMYYRLAPAQERALAEHVELIMFAGGYAGLQLIEDGQANLCFLVDQTRLARAGGRFDMLLEQMCNENAHLAARLSGASALLQTPLTIANVPYGFIHENAADASPDLYRLGDQAGVIQSFTGDGMSIALHSAALAAQAFLSGQNALVFQRRLRADITGQIRRAGAIHGFLKFPCAQSALFGMARIWPGALAWAAQATRVPASVRL